MVFFTCNHCGSSLKKNRVDKHYATECRANPSLSCMDCMKDFYGEEYKTHTKCMTEDQKYSGKPIDPTSAIGKGEKKQLMWLETVRQIVETKGSSLTPQERQLLETMKDFENIPRKKKKFENFLKNVMKRFIDQRTIDRVWALLEEHKPVVTDNKSTNGSAKDESKEIPIGGISLEENSSKEKVGEEDVAKRGVKSSNEICKDKNDSNMQQCKRSSEEGKKTIKKNGCKDVAELEGINEEKTRSKKRKRKATDSVDLMMSNAKIGGEEEETIDDKELSADDVDGTCPEVDITKLSKKERKEKKKREKYIAELNSAANDVNLDIGDMDVVPSDSNGIIVHKSKKSRKANKNVQIENGKEVEVNDNIKMKKSKKKHKANLNGATTNENSGGIEEVEGTGSECQMEKDFTASLDDGSDKPKGKFKWNKTIVSVLQSAPENELLVKRLRKKVLAEYQQSLENEGSRECSLEEALGMFDRKLRKIPGIRIFKDRAKLVASSE